MTHFPNLSCFSRSTVYEVSDPSITQPPAEIVPRAAGGGGGGGGADSAAAVPSKAAAAAISAADPRPAMAFAGALPAIIQTGIRCAVAANGPRALFDHENAEYEIKAQKFIKLKDEVESITKSILKFLEDHPASESEIQSISESRLNRNRVIRDCNQSLKKIRNIDLPSNNNLYKRFFVEKMKELQGFLDTKTKQYDEIQKQFSSKLTAKTLPPKTGAAASSKAATAAATAIGDGGGGGGGRASPNRANTGDDPHPLMMRSGSDSIRSRLSGEIDHDEDDDDVIQALPPELQLRMNPLAGIGASITVDPNYGKRFARGSMDISDEAIMRNMTAKSGELSARKRLSLARASAAAAGFPPASAASGETSGAALNAANDATAASAAASPRIASMSAAAAPATAETRGGGGRSAAEEPSSAAAASVDDDFLRTSLATTTTTLSASATPLQTTTVSSLNVSRSNLLSSDEDTTTARSSAGAASARESVRRESVVMGSAAATPKVAASVAAGAAGAAALPTIPLLRKATLPPLIRVGSQRTGSQKPVNGA